MRRFSPQFWRSNDWFLHNDNASIDPAYERLFDLSGVPCISLYSPDLTPWDFFLFSGMKKKKILKGKRFDDVEAVKTAAHKADPLMCEKILSRASNAMDSILKEIGENL